MPKHPPARYGRVEQFMLDEHGTTSTEFAFEKGDGPWLAMRLEEHSKWGNAGNYRKLQIINVRIKPPQIFASGTLLGNEGAKQARFELMSKEGWGKALSVRQAIMKACTELGEEAFLEGWWEGVGKIREIDRRNHGIRYENSLRKIKEEPLKASPAPTLEKFFLWMVKDKGSRG